MMYGWCWKFGVYLNVYIGIELFFIFKVEFKVICKMKLFGISYNLK